MYKDLALLLIAGETFFIHLQQELLSTNPTITPLLIQFNVI